MLIRSTAEENMSIFLGILNMSRFDPTKPFNQLPPLPPSVDLETPVVLKACIEALFIMASVL